MTKRAVLEWLARDRLVPVVRASSPDSALELIDAMLDGGITIFEVTMTVPGAVELIARIAREHSDRILLGAGTVLDPDTARACVHAGARFVVSPALDVQTVLACNALDVVVAPGALTPTEILTAWRSGADVVKVFPCDAMGGANYLKSIKAPMPHIPLMPTGGVTLDNLQEFIRAGAVAIGVGGNLVDAKIGRDALAERARAFVERARAA